MQTLLKQCSGACKRRQLMPLAMSGGKISCSLLYSHWRDVARVWLQERQRSPPVCALYHCKYTKGSPFDKIQILRRRPNVLHFHIHGLWLSLKRLCHYHTIPLSAHMDRVKPPTCTGDRSSTAVCYMRQSQQQDACQITRPLTSVEHLLAKPTRFREFEEVNVE